MVDHENEDTRRWRGDYIVDRDEKPWMMMVIVDLMTIMVITMDNSCFI